MNMTESKPSQLEQKPSIFFCFNRVALTNGASPLTWEWYEFDGIGWRPVDPMKPSAPNEKRETGKPKTAIRTEALFEVTCPHCGGDITEPETGSRTWTQADYVETIGCNECGEIVLIPNQSIKAQ